MKFYRFPREQTSDYRKACVRRGNLVRSKICAAGPESCYP